MSQNITKKELEAIYNSLPLLENSIREDIGVVLSYWDTIVIMAENIKKLEGLDESN